jgi:hypothetical protein
MQAVFSSNIVLPLFIFCHLCCCRALTTAAWLPEASSCRHQQAACNEDQFRGQSATTSTLCYTWLSSNAAAAWLHTHQYAGSCYSLLQDVCHFKQAFDRPCNLLCLRTVMVTVVQHKHVISSKLCHDRQHCCCKTTGASTICADIYALVTAMHCRNRFHQAEMQHRT